MNKPIGRLCSLVAPMGVAMVFASLGAFAQTPSAAASKAASAKPAPAVAKPAAATKPAPAVAKPAPAPKPVEAAKPVEMADEVGAFDYALLTPGFWAGEHYFEG